MALRLKIRKEIKQTLEEDGFTQEEIKEQLNDLVEEELQRQDKERERQSQERIRIQEIEIERQDKERQSQQEFELRKLELEKNSNERNNEEQSELSSNCNKHEDPILAYDDSSNISVWLDYFEVETERKEKNSVFQKILH